MSNRFIVIVVVYIILVFLAFSLFAQVPPENSTLRMIFGLVNAAVMLLVTYLIVSFLDLRKGESLSVFLARKRAEAQAERDQVWAQAARLTQASLPQRCARCEHASPAETTWEIQIDPRSTRETLRGGKEPLTIGVPICNKCHAELVAARQVQTVGTVIVVVVGAILGIVIGLNRPSATWRDWLWFGTLGVLIGGLVYLVLVRPLISYLSNDDFVSVAGSYRRLVFKSWRYQDLFEKANLEPPESPEKPVEE